VPLLHKRENYADKLRKENRLDSIKKKRDAVLSPQNNFKLKESREILARCGLILYDYTDEVRV
jgi:hypothetical protein